MTQITQRIICPAGKWTQLTQTSRIGSIRLAYGNALVTEATALPTSEINQTPISAGFSIPNQDAVYNIADGAILFAWANVETAFDISPSEGAL